MDKLFTIGANWETVSDGDRIQLKEFISRLVGYPCKIACKDAENIVDIFVMSDHTGRIEDWIELHVNGAVCPSDDMYADKRRRVKDSVVEACDTHNAKYGVEPYPGEEVDDDDCDDEDEESQERDDDTGSDESDNEENDTDDD